MVEGRGAWDGEDIWGEGAASEGRDESSIGAVLLWGRERMEGGKREGERMEEEGVGRKGG